MKTRDWGRTVAGALALGVALLAAGCSSTATGGDQTQEPVATGTTSSPTLEQARTAGTIAGEIEKEPNRAAEIFAAHGVTSESFESLIIEIAQDSLLTVAYEAGKVAAK